MMIPLVGGPRDGQYVDIEVGRLGYIDEHGQAWQSDQLWIDDDLEVYFPHDEKTIHPIAIYRWLFGAADHLDFAGYEKNETDSDHSV